VPGIELKSTITNETTTAYGRQEAGPDTDFTGIVFC